MLTLLKQARAFGVGVILTTQNPVDLDYKGLTNAGTWFIGRLQTERDKMRVLDGLEGASSEVGLPLDRDSLGPVLKVYSLPGETEREFRMRLKQMAREERDEDVDKLHRRYERRLRRLADRLRRAETVLDKKESEAEARKREVLVSIGESVLGVLMGRRSTRVASSAMRRYRQSSSAGMAVEEAEEKVEALQREIADLEEELQEQVDEITARWNEALEQIEEFPVTPRRQDIKVDLFALAWAPHWRVTYVSQGSIVRTELVPAY